MVEDSANYIREHIGRRHRLYACVRCCETFQNQKELTAHLREPDHCEVREKIKIPPEEGIDDDLMKKLKPRTGLKGLDEVAKWNRLNRYVFGSDLAYDPAPCKLTTNPFSMSLILSRL